MAIVWPLERASSHSDCDSRVRLQLCLVSDDRRRIIAIPEERFFKALFYLGHVIIPTVGVILVLESARGCLELSWPLLTVFAVVLLPVLLPLFAVYVGKVFGIEFNELPRFAVLPAPPTEGPSETEPINPEPGPTLESSSPATVPYSQSPPLLVREWPLPEALAPEERKVLRTLWKRQSEFLKEGKKELWGFVVGVNSTDYEQFLRGSTSLAQRRLIGIGAKGIVFLTTAGIGYCTAYASSLSGYGEAWDHFAPG